VSERKKAEKPEDILNDFRKVINRMFFGSWYKHNSPEGERWLVAVPTFQGSDKGNPQGGSVVLVTKAKTNDLQLFTLMNKVGTVRNKQGAELALWETDRVNL
jgi:hypothetical protein